MYLILWMVLSSVALAIGVAMILIALSNYNRVLSLGDNIGIILGVIGIIIGVVIAYRQNEQTGEIDNAVKDIQEYSRKTDQLQRAWILLGIRVLNVEPYHTQ